MVESTRLTIKFRHCDYAEDYAAATAAYDSAAATAWVRGFTAEQRAYWATREGGLINGYAEEYAARRLESIAGTAQSVYSSCMFGGASAPVVQTGDPQFRLVLQTKLDSTAPANANSNTLSGLSARLAISFKPAAPLSDKNWKAFYRLDTVHTAYNLAENWNIPQHSNTPPSLFYSEPSYQSLAMRNSVNVAANDLVSIWADFVPYLEVPDGVTITDPRDISAAQNSLGIASGVISGVIGALPPDETGVTVKADLTALQASLAVVMADLNSAFGIGNASSGLKILSDTLDYIVSQLQSWYVADTPTAGLLAAVQPIEAASLYLKEAYNALSANLTAVESYFSFMLIRQVNLPDGQQIQNEAEYLEGLHTGAQPDVNATMSFPALNTTCNVSGTVDVYYFITSYAFGTLYKLQGKIQQVRAGGSDHDYMVWANAFDATPPSYGPPGLKSFHESFNFQAIPIGIIRIKYVRQGVFQYQRMFLIWNGPPVDPAHLVGMTSSAVGTKFYGKHLTETFSLSEPITLSGGSTLNDVTLNGNYTFPVVADFVVRNFITGTMTIESGSNAVGSLSVYDYMALNNGVLSIKNVLKPLATFTPYGPFVTEQPSYQAYGNFLSVLPDFIDYLGFSAFGVSVLYIEVNGAVSAMEVYLCWKSTPSTQAAWKTCYSSLPNPGLAISMPLGGVPPTFQVTFTSNWLPSTLESLSIINEPQVTLTANISVSAWEADNSLPWGSMFTTTDNGAYESKQALLLVYTERYASASAAYQTGETEAYAAMTAANAQAFAELESQYAAIQGLIGTPAFYAAADAAHQTWMEAIAANTALYIAEREILLIQVAAAGASKSASEAHLNAAWTSWEATRISRGITGYAALGTLTVPSANILVSEASVRGQRIVRRNVLAPKPTERTDLKGTLTGPDTSPWVFGDTLPDFY